MPSTFMRSIYQVVGQGILNMYFARTAKATVELYVNMVDM